MSEVIAEPIRAVVDTVYRSDSRRVLATLIRLLGDFDLAEEALHEAFAAAVERWPRDGVPANPRAWLVSTGRFKAIDGLRRRSRFDAALVELADRLDASREPDMIPDEESIEDDRLQADLHLLPPCSASRFPAGPDATRSLRTHHRSHRARFLTKAPTVAQRIVRAKAKIRDAGIPYQVPSRADLPERLAIGAARGLPRLQRGYAPSSGESLTRHDLSEEAIRLGRLLVELLPEPEVMRIAGADATA